MKSANPLVLTDDDISGTFTFLRALEDNGPELTPEQIGAQIFIDGWGMVCPGDTERAADPARRAASVSHDGEAVYAAQVVAAMEAAAFSEPDIGRLLDTGAAFIPRDSATARVIEDVRGRHAADGDWRRTRARIGERYGPHRYPGICHVVPNHALIILGLLYGDGDLDRSLMVVDTAGWDTDCNSGNLAACSGFAAASRRSGRTGATRYATGCTSRAPTAAAITDAATEAVHVVNVGRRLRGEPRWRPPRFHFSFPGSVQGFDGEHDGGALAVDGIATTPTFIPPEALTMTGYELQASPMLHPGQTVRAKVEGAPARLLIRVYDSRDELGPCGPPRACSNGASRTRAGSRSPRWASRHPARRGCAR